MSLTASMWTSVSGLIVHGERMNVIGNNISNINTVGFKGARMDFEDFIYQSVGTAAGMGQVGRGTSIGVIMNDFDQGSMETTTSTTDIAIGGNGFFKVKPRNDNTEYYTRAGNFRFDKDGYLVDPHGYALQGWKVDNAARSVLASSGATASSGSTIIGTGSPTDIRMDKFSCDPRATTSMTLAVNLDSAKGNDKVSVPDNPFFSLLSTWDATPDGQGRITPLGSQQYAYSNTIDVYDAGGQLQKLTVYFDRVTQTHDTNIENLKSSEIVWEYIVTMDPANDLRNFTDNPATPLPDKYKGLLMSGTLTFDSSGQFRDMTGYVPTSNKMGDLSTWEQAPISSNGYPMLTGNFSGKEGASSALNTNTVPPTVNHNAALIELNLGLRDMSPSWSIDMPRTIADWTSKVTTGGLKDIYKTVKDTNGHIVYYQARTAAAPTPPDYPAGWVYPGGPESARIPFDFPTITPGVGQVADAEGLIFQQRKVSQGIGAGQAAGIGTAGEPNYVYVQESGTHNGHTGLIFYDKEVGTNKQYVLENDLYYDINNPADTGSTAEQLAAAGVKITAFPDMTQPVATSEPYPSTMPEFQLDADGHPVQATATRLYPGMGTNAELQNTTSTSYTNNTGNNFYERFKSQDGYTYGELRYVTVGQDGVLSAAYSNGVTLELYQITLHDFPSKQHLRREGGNLFTETRDSGLPISGAANTGTFGATKSNSLEQSNVDLSREFVNMITTQKGFQANSKSITTVDTMLDTVIQMKR